MSRIPSPQDDRRACLCPDGTYSRECCDGSLMAQGIGNITTEIKSNVDFYFAETYHQQYLYKNPNGYCGLGGCGVKFK